MTNRLCIHHLIAAQAERNPEATAIAAPGRRALTYGRLWTQLQYAVAKLNAMGIGRGDRVGVVLPNGPEMAAAFIAVAAGASSAPLNPTYRAREFDFHLSDLNAKALIIQCGMDSPARAVAQALGIPIIELLPAPEEEAGVFTLWTERTGCPVYSGLARCDDVALVLHTSGTTSRPKMVPLTQANVCTSARNIRVALELVETDRCLNVMPLFHIHGLIGALLSSLAAGASVYCTPGFYAPKFFDWIEEFCPSWYTAVPTMHQAILARAASRREIIARRPLRFIRSSSAALPPQVLMGLEDVFGAPVIESYGMTEAAHQVASNPLPPRKRKPGSVGVAAGPEVAVMDEEGTLLPQGSKGEIVIRGANVMRGYENNADANQGAFTQGWFRTGDQGYLDGEGYLFITGRLKEIINRGGEKISPREIDEVLLDHPDVCQAVAFAVPHPTLGEDIIAAVVVREEARLTEASIRRYLFGRLAEFKIPSQVLIVDAIPKGVTGKMQRTQMGEKFAKQLKGEFVAPKNGVETIVASIYGDVLGIERVSTKDNFFALGGDSLRGTQVISRVRAMFHVNLPIVTLFKRPSVSELADEISRSLEASGQASLTEILKDLETLSEDHTEEELEGTLGCNPSSKCAL